MEILRRPRRLRATKAIRDLVHETDLHVSDLIYPVFVVEGEHIKEEIPSMPGIFHYSLDTFQEHLKEIAVSGVKSVIFFGVPDHKDEVGSGAYDDEGIVQRALRLTKSLYPELICIADICLCEYTSHGHCGLVKDGCVLNDPTLELLSKAALSCARAGADIVAPSDMMDGRIGHMRRTLDGAGFENTLIMAYSIKYASAFYGPFREAADSAPAFGDRRSYQMDWRNKKEAIVEAALDVEEGADILMVKPALAYLDMVKTISDRFDLPLCTYSVSGEYSMMKAAALNGWINEKSVVMESMTAMKRAGAKMIITYYALDIARWLIEEA
ncbi:porphobilinogen synthase [Catenibacillus scindens]|uniref:Delta-aminolevulinic acid dehydratase n=1 Tax=Catenibacillus scindens TaxID=673271 RepID=A0A7W8HCG1_9FIRM|nr:porphobilinogen synthase [Catenibacillus scindens]MBB5265936.1 porphobilinogen synthase [Catenibacillus scindens]